MTPFKLKEAVVGRFTQLSAGKNAGKGIPGTVIEVKEHTGILRCAFKTKRGTIVEDFTLDGISIRGEEYGHIAPLSFEDEKVMSEKMARDAEIADLLEKARAAFGTDDQQSFIDEQAKIAELGSVTPRNVLILMGLVTGFCKSSIEKPSPETIATIRACFSR